MKKVNFDFLLFAIVLTLIFSCSKDTNNDPPATPAPTPPDTRELVVQAQFVIPGSFPNFVDSLVDVPNIKIVMVGGQSEPSALLTYYTSNSYTKNADANGIARFLYTSLSSYGVGSSGSIGILAYNPPFYGAYGTNFYLDNTTYSFDNRNVYDTIKIKLRAYMWQHLASYSKWNLFYASVNGVVSNVATSCNNDDYIVFEILSNWYNARLTYFDGTDTCTGFPSTNPIIHYSRSFISAGDDGNPRLNARYNTTTNKIELTAQTSIQNHYASTNSAHQNFFGYNITTYVDGDTLKLISQEAQSGNGFIVVKKFVAAP